MDLSGVKYIKKIYLLANSAEPAPPLGTVLGNIGANAGTFCTQFNAFTAQLPTYLALKTTIYIYENKSMTFIVDKPSTSYLLSILKFEKLLKVKVTNKMQDKLVICISLHQVLKLAKFIHPTKPLAVSFRIIMGTVNAMKIKVI